MAPMTQEQNVAVVVSTLSELIQTSKTCLESERTAPQRTADAMDDYIAHHGRRVAELRRIRNEFEDLMAEQTGRGG